MHSGAQMSAVAERNVITGVALDIECFRIDVAPFIPVRASVEHDASC